MPELEVFRLRSRTGTHSNKFRGFTFWKVFFWFWECFRYHTAHRHRYCAEQDHETWQSRTANPPVDVLISYLVIILGLHICMEQGPAFANPSLTDAVWSNS